MTVFAPHQAKAVMLTATRDKRTKGAQDLCQPELIHWKQCIFKCLFSLSWYIWDVIHRVRHERLPDYFVNRQYAVRRSLTNNFEFSDAL